MPPQCGLVIEYVGSRLRIGCKYIVQNFPHAAARSFGLRTLHETLNVRGEDDPCHSSLSAELTGPVGAPRRSLSMPSLPGLRHEFGPSMSPGSRSDRRAAVCTPQGRTNLVDPD